MYRLVIIDDEEASREALCQSFAWDQFGFEVVAQFGNARIAFDWIDANPVDLILCDIVMPGMDGLELARLIYTHHPEIKFVFFSAHPDFEYAKTAIEYGVKAYLIKPVRYKELLDILAKIKSQLDSEQIVSATTTPAKSLGALSFQDRIIQRVNEYLENNYRNATLEGAAELVRMNPSYLSQFYKSQTGLYFSNVLTRIRMEHARELLNDVRNHVSDVSEMVGYSNAKNFSRAFKNYFGRRPNEERRKS